MRFGLNARTIERRKGVYHVLEEAENLELPCRDSCFQERYLHFEDIESFAIYEIRRMFSKLRECQY